MTPDDIYNIILDKSKLVAFTKTAWEEKAKANEPSDFREVLPYEEIAMYMEKLGKYSVGCFNIVTYK